MNLNVPESSAEVVDAVISASRVLVAVAAKSLSDVANEVSLAQFRTLVVLASRGPQNLSGLAELVGVTAATATRMCDRLVKKGLVVRDTAQDDRRQVRLELTPRGRSVVDAVTDRRRQEIARIVQAIAPQEQWVLVFALRQFAQAAGEMSDRQWSTGWATS